MKSEEESSLLSSLEEKLGCHYHDKSLLITALTHSSYSREQAQQHHKKPGPDYERLEFLGDAVLELVTSQMLYERFNWPEGELTKARAKIVCEESLSYVARQYDLGKYLLLSHGEDKTGGRDRSSILCDVVESLIGAMYLDQGLEEASHLIHRMILDHLDELPLADEVDHKSQLQEYLQGKGLGSPCYEVVKEEGPAHRRVFTVRLYIEGIGECVAKGPSKKEAEQRTACMALEKIGKAPKSIGSIG